jgi:hypothetical protein
LFGDAVGALALAVFRCLYDAELSRGVLSVP